MGKRVRWERIEHAYVTGDYSYRDLSSKYKIPSRTLSEEAKKREWVKKRKAFRDEAAAAAIAQAKEEETDRLIGVKRTCDKMGELLEKIAGSERLIHMHAGILRTEDGDEYFGEKELETPNNETIRVIMTSLRDLTSVLTRVYSIMTEAERQQLGMQREKIELERRRTEAEIAKSSEGRDSEISVTLAPELEGLDE